ncbi:GDSL-type esterase/lipase family protein [Streptomyces sp. NBC_01446]|uniref:GDSL-type esterase/lipase family protein n=1 Tax=Streptomyces sp. NBC_00119 TaxID=2975659 RepID=A0AAU1U3F0_9ACTN|nr:GDSL-type esterase/lipase family protein [Streptomyces sp. NBC_01446]MCX4642504.1 GDSL-type esterase/lipase family protein [Streptomyces sp. NBC_01446]
MNRTLFVLGDSIPAPRTEEEAPMAGWGQKIQELLVGPVEVANYARSAMTTRKYFTQRLPALLNRMSRGDIVLIGFGCVDHMIHNGARYVPVPEYQELLRLFAAYVHEQGAVPVLVTPMARYAFSAQGEVLNTLGDHPRAMAEVAARLGVPLVDLTTRTMQLWSQLGPTRLRQYFCWTDPGEHPLHPDGTIDSAHLNHTGAFEVARLVLAELCNLGVLDKSEVNVPALMEPLMVPPVSGEFTVQAPESSLRYGQGTGPAPVITKPAQGGLAGAMVKFSGNAASGTDYLLFFEQGRYIGGTSVGGAGQWSWRRSVNWEAGERLVQCVGLRGDGVSAIAEHRFTVLTDVPSPLVTAPAEGAFTGPRPRFSGRVQPGVTKVVLKERGVLIGATGVDDQGEWAFKHAHAWRPGTHTIEVIALFGAAESAPAPHTFRVVGIPEDSPIRSLGVTRHACGDVCEHRPFTGDW